MKLFLVIYLLDKKIHIFFVEIEYREKTLFATALILYAILDQSSVIWFLQNLNVHSLQNLKSGIRKWKPKKYN